MKVSLFLNAFFVILILCLQSNYAQEYEHETDKNIPALSDFHEVIYPIWHEAFPEKNYQLLRDFSDDVKNSAQKIYEVELPGILRDKESKWSEGINKFKMSVEEYVSASMGDDDARLLKAAEVLHSNYENLVRTIRPVLKEVEEYHKDLYMIYHHYLPGNELDKVKGLTSGLMLKAEALKDAKLPSRLSAKQDQFDKAVVELIGNTKIFISSVESEDPEIMNQKLDEMHSSYQKLEAVFD
ncbi:MAG: hypothetical protein IPM56_11545 [Ignavibacteriales bacterium]|nr:MAG: hypothetical protein IPM56_11545 [Ignavibacteriales bacterium]